MTTPRMFWGVTLLWLAVTVYTNERVLAPEVITGLIENTTGSEMSVLQVDRLRRQGRWAQLLLPVLLVLRVGVAALVLQLFAMLMARDLPYGVAFRSGLLGFVAVVYGTFVRILRLDLLPPGELTRADLDLVPDSLGVLFPGAADVTALSASLSVLSVHDALWIGIVTASLAASTGFRRREALNITLAAWATTAVVRVGAQVLIEGLTG